jgi:hypothetical protein
MRRLALLLALGCAAPPASPWPALPASVPSVLGPVRVEVLPDPSFDGVKVLGSWNSYRRVIQIRAGLHPATAWQTLRHERCHMELWDAGVVIGDEALEDRICDAMGTADVREMR